MAYKPRRTVTFFTLLVNMQRELAQARINEPIALTFKDHPSMLQYLAIWID
jgi:hypothetical protein